MGEERRQWDRPPCSSIIRWSVRWRFASAFSAALFAPPDPGWPNRRLFRWAFWGKINGFQFHPLQIRSNRRIYWYDVGVNLTNVFFTPMKAIKTKRVALYARVSTKDKGQDVENQLGVSSGYVQNVIIAS